GGHHGTDRVLESGTRDDLTRPHVFFEELHDAAPCLAHHFTATLVGRGNTGRSGGRDPKSFERGRHRVGGELTAARARAGTGVALELEEVFVAHLADRMLAHRLEDVADRDVLALELPGDRKSTRLNSSHQII